MKRSLAVLVGMLALAASPNARAETASFDTGIDAAADSSLDTFVDTLLETPADASEAAVDDALADGLGDVLADSADAVAADAGAADGDANVAIDAADAGHDAADGRVSASDGAPDVTGDGADFDSPSSESGVDADDTATDDTAADVAAADTASADSEADGALDAGKEAAVPSDDATFGGSPWIVAPSPADPRAQPFVNGSGEGCLCTQTGASRGSSPMALIVAAVFIVRARRGGATRRSRRT